MNLILFERGELDAPIPKSDPRIQHLIKVLRVKKDEEFDAGIVDGERGRGWIQEDGSAGVHVMFRPVDVPPPPFELRIAVGVNRPQTARKIISQAATMGVEEIHFFPTQKGESNYLSSRVYRDREVRKLLVEGVQHSFSTKLPSLEIHSCIEECLERESGSESICLDNYESTGLLGGYSFRFLPLTLWFGGERGWSQEERCRFRSHSIPLLSLGDRVLRTETAVVAAVAVSLSAFGYL